MKTSLVLTLVFILSACSRLDPKSRFEAMRVSDERDDLNSLVIEESFKNRALESIEALRKKPKRLLFFGKCEVSSSDYADTLEQQVLLSKDLKSSLKDSFVWYDYFGKEEWGKILLTSYYSPVIEGRRSAQGEFNYPLFSTPKDLVEVEMKRFSKEDLIHSEVIRSKVAARIKKSWSGISRIVPYYSRGEIDKNFKVVQKQAEVLAFVRPIEAFFFHIQGSGLIRFKDNSLISLGYASQNGHRYHSIGKLLYDKIPREEMTKAKIENFLHDLSRDELFEFLANNPSYVFFKRLKEGIGRTTFGPEVQERATIAIDPRFISLGSLALLTFSSPSFDDISQQSPSSFNDESRLVWAHDTGGAIKGAGRADLYWGRGVTAGQAAGVINQRARLWVLAPKSCHTDN